MTKQKEEQKAGETPSDTGTWCTCDLGFSHPEIRPCADLDITPPGVCLHCSHDAECHVGEGK